MKRNQKGKFVKRVGGETFEGFSVWHDSKGYPRICIDGKDIMLHVYVWERKNGSKPRYHQIHHKDFDKANHEYKNLELLTSSDHQRIHAGWIKTNGKWTHKICSNCKHILPLSEFYERKGLTPSNKCKICHCEQTKKWAKNNKEKRRIIARNWWRRKYGKEVVPYA